MMYTTSYQAISQYTDAEEAQIALDEAILDAYDLAMEAAEAKIRAALAQQFGQPLDEIEAIISDRTAQRHIWQRLSWESERKGKRV